jgi:hypothetical protein
MMELTKAEMEDIWQNKPVGYFATLKKSLKGTKKYRLQLEPYTYNYLPKEIIEVRAKTICDAQMLARSEYINKHKNLRPDGYIYRNLT